MAETLTDRVQSLQRELRALKSQQLATDPSDIRVHYGATTSIRVVKPAGSTNDVNVKAYFLPDVEGQGQPLYQLWIDRRSKMPDDFINATYGYLALKPVQTIMQDYIITLPFISYQEQVYELWLYASSLVPGKLYAEVA